LGLDDAVYVLQLISGKRNPPYNFASPLLPGDVNGDHQLGLDDAIQILQLTSRLTSP